MKWIQRIPIQLIQVKTWLKITTTLKLIINHIMVNIKVKKLFHFFRVDVYVAMQGPSQGLKIRRGGVGVGWLVVLLWA